MNDTVDRFYQATGEWMVKAADYDALSARCDELERRLAGAWVVRELEWKEDGERQCHADTAIGRIVIRQQYYDQKWWVDAPTRYSSSELYDSLDAAKAAAQEWFNEKMTAGLMGGATHVNQGVSAVNLNQFIEQWNEIAESDGCQVDGDYKLCVHAGGGIGSSGYEIESIDVGFDWNKGKIMLRTKTPLTVADQTDIRKLKNRVMVLCMSLAKAVEQGDKQRSMELIGLIETATCGRVMCGAESQAKDRKSTKRGR